MRQVVRVLEMLGVTVCLVSVAGCASVNRSVEEGRAAAAARRADRLQVEEERAMRTEVVRKRYLQIGSEPSLARVYVDERFIGLTPTGTSVRFNLHSYDPPYSRDTVEVRVTKDGYEAVTRLINFSDFQPVENKGPFTSLDRKGVAYFLIPTVRDEGAAEGEVETAVVTFTSAPDAAEIYLDNGYIGATPKLHLRIPAGSHQVKLTRKGYQDWERNLNVIVDSETVVEATLEKK